MSEEVRILSMFMQGKTFDEIASELGIERRRVESVVNSILGQRAEEERDEQFTSFEDELLSLYLMQKRRVMRYLNLEKNMRIPLPETKDNLVILLKILEVMWKVQKGGRLDLMDMKRSIFDVESV